MNSSESVAAIAPNWIAALNELEDITREHTADTGSYKYRYSSLDQATKQARLVLTKHKLAVHQEVAADQLGSVMVTTRVWHASGEWIESRPLMMPAKGGPQDVGSSTAYARRYALMAFLGLATDDDDGAGAQKAAQEADKPHPNSERVSAVVTDMRRLTDAAKESLRSFADGRKLTPNALLTDERWLVDVENWLSEWEHDHPQGQLAGVS